MTSLSVDNDDGTPRSGILDDDSQPEKMSDKRITLNCTDMSGRVIPITIYEYNPLGECISDLTFGDCMGRCLDDDGRIKARIRLVTVSGFVIHCCEGPKQNDLCDGDSLSIILESERDTPLSGSGKKPSCNGCDAAIELRARRRTVEPDDTKTCTDEQLMKLFSDWQQEFIMNPSGLPTKGLTNQQKQRMSRQTHRSAFKAHLKKFFGGHEVVMALWRWNGTGRAPDLDDL